MKTTLFTILSVCIAGILLGQSKLLPYSTGFDSPAEKAGWQEYRTKFQSTGHWEYSSQGFSGTCISHDYNVGGNPTDTVLDWFVSPPLKLTAQSLMSLKLKTTGFSTPLPDNLQVLYCSKKQNPSLGTFISIANLSLMQPQYQWLDTTITVPFISDSGYIAIRYKTIGPAWTTYAIDHISISTLPVSLKEHSNSRQQVTVYPNPFYNNCSVLLSNEAAAASPAIRLFDSYGRELNTLATLQGNTLHFNRDNLKAGMYYIQVLSNNQIIATEKLVITD